MFSKGNKPSGSEVRTEASSKGVPSIISSDLTITGDLVSGGEIQVDGTIDGDIRCKTLIIGVNGAVNGEIDADSVRLHGRVSGQVRAKTVFLAATAHMIGDITHESLAIEPGAFMEGHCGRMSEVIPRKVDEIAAKGGKTDAKPAASNTDGAAEKGKAAVAAL